MRRRSYKRSRQQPSNNLAAAAVEMCFSPPPFIKPHKSTGAKREGELYEAKAHDYLGRVCPQYAPAPWLRVLSNTATPSPAFRQPDGIILDILAGKITIVEIKLRHTDKARQQLRLGYEPLVRRLFGETLWEFSCLEVVRWFDPHTFFGEPFRMVHDPAGVDPGHIGVHIYRP